MIALSSTSRPSTSIDDIQQRLVEDVRIARRHYLADIANHRGLGDPAIAHFLSRLKRSRLAVSLGESVPTIFCNLLQTSGRNAARFTEAWMYLYHHSLLVDDMSDGHAETTGQNASTAAYLLDRALDLWKSCGGFTGEMIDVFLNYYEEQIAAGEQPIGAHHAIGHRGALVKYFVSVLTVHRSGRLLSSAEERGIEAILGGFQILDDVTDRHEDQSANTNFVDLRIAGKRAANLLSEGLDLVQAEESSDLARFVGNYIERIHEAVSRPSCVPGNRPSLPMASN
jgi:hypothetical protein